jgi:hypothetical protein
MREVISTSLCNVIIFACLAGVATVSPEADKMNPKAFGVMPFGYPVNRVVFVAVSLLYLPLVPAVCGLVRLKFIQAAMDKAAERQEWEHVEWLSTMKRQPLRLALFGLAYFVTISFVWIVWTETQGL